MYVADASKLHSARCDYSTSDPIGDLIFAATHHGWCPLFIHWLRENRYLLWPGEPDKLEYYGWILQGGSVRFDRVPYSQFARALVIMERPSNC
jgi:hypothetical protein